MNKKVYLLENCIDCPDSYGFVTTTPIEKKEYLTVYCERLGRVCERSVGIDSECPLFDQKDIKPTKLVEVDDGVEDLARQTLEIQKKYYELKGKYKQLQKDYDDLKCFGG